MTRYLGALAALVAAALGAGPAPAAPPDPQQLMASAMGEAPAPPAMGVLVIRDGLVAEVAVRGVRSLDTGIAVRPDDRWHLGSDGKAITAVMIARLVEAGRLSWSAPLHRLLPTTAMRPEYRDVTLAELLTHTAGIAEPADALLLDFLKDSRPLPRQRMEWTRAALAMAPVGPRGQADYSNTGYVIAAVVAEQATGKSYERLVTEQVLEPLGLTSATFDPAGLPGDIVGHLDGAATGPLETNPPMWGPAGGLRMSLRDWARFCIDQMEGARGRGALLSPEGYRRLHAPSDDGSAMGWQVMGEFAGRRGPILQHSGSDGNWFVAAALFPESRDGLLVVANAGRSMNGNDATMKVAMPVLQTLSSSVKAADDRPRPEGSR